LDTCAIWVDLDGAGPRRGEIRRIQQSDRDRVLKRFLARVEERDSAVTQTKARFE
jgi:hypothetical protein